MFIELNYLQLDEDDTDTVFFNILGTCMYEFMDKSKSVFPNALLSKEDFKRDQWKRCMVFVFMGRWVYGKDGQKQWRLFQMADLKFNMRAFEMWKRMESLVRLWYPSCHHTNLSCLLSGHESHRKVSETGGRLRRPAEAQTSWARPLPQRL
jgi:hypothetical protein